jgi:type VI secretion system protein ImpL
MIIRSSRWIVRLAGTALLALLVWFFAPLLPGLDSIAPRLAIVLLVFLAWVGSELLLDIRQRRRDAALVAGIAARPADEAEEVQALRARLAHALDLLKKSLRSRGYLYQQPWYAIIGPPGAGKTTALLNAGLRFPLADTLGQGAVAGVAGTRLCDWWFTEDAVLIDTAGRYTTQDSNDRVDRAGWVAFLDLLKTTRPRQPLNGLLVAFPLNDLAMTPENERKAHAVTIRRRINELQMRLDVRLPVYVLFTKADLIAGFTEFFDDLDGDKRAQVWGTTFDMAANGHDPVAAFPGEMHALLEQLNARLFDRMQAECNPERRARIAMFPGQLASLEPVVREFLTAAFGGGADDPAPLLRGVYFTSGTQEGTPFDRLTGTLARTLGVETASSQSLQPVRGRSYFLERLLKQVIFGEAQLVLLNPATAQRRMMLRMAGYAASGLLVIATAAVLWQVRGGGQREIDTARAALAGYEQTAHGLALDPVADDDLARLAPLLDQARALPRGEREPSWLPAILSQREKLAASARAVYRHALEWALLPRLIYRLESQLRGNLNNPDFLYEATRVYLMLGNAGPLDASLLRGWMKLDWQAAYPGVGYARLRDSLSQHLDALLAEPLSQVRLDGALVAAARARLASVPLAERVYSRIRRSAAAQRVPPWRPSDSLGPAGAPLFVRASGKPLTDGIPGFFTVSGFHKVLLPLLEQTVRSVASESWVLGNRVAFDPDGPEMQVRQREVIGIYEADYAPAWDLMLADLNVVQPLSLSQAAQDLYILAGPESPMRNLLVSIRQQLSLSQAGVAPATPVPSAAGSDTDRRFHGLFGASQPGTAASLPGQEIDARFQALRDVVAPGVAAPIEQVLRELSDAQQQIAKLAAALLSPGAAPSSPSGIDPLLVLKSDGARQPQPLGRWLSEIATSAMALRSGDARQQLAAVFDGPAGPAETCSTAVNGHYPFIAGAADEVSIADFARLFAPGAALDGFMNTLLRRYVDMSGKTWRPVSADTGSAPVSPADVLMFQRAAAIRDAFFPDDGTRPRFRMDITPVGLDPGTTQVLLDIDGASIALTRGAQRGAQVTWPSFAPQPTARLVFEPPAKGGELHESGPWALFRLFSHGRMQAQAGSTDRYSLMFQLGERQATFDVRIPGGTNPFAPGLLQDFHCPSVRAN